MQNNTKKPAVYVPGSSVKSRETDFGTCFKISFKVEDFGKFVKEHKNAKGYINLEMTPRKEVGQYGDTHSLKLDTWEPKQQDGQAAPKSAPAKKAAPRQEDEDSDSIPF